MPEAKVVGMVEGVMENGTVKGVGVDYSLQTF